MGACASSPHADGSDAVAMLYRSKAVEAGVAKAVGGGTTRKCSAGAAAAPAAPAAHIAVLCDAESLPDEVLCDILSSLPLVDLVQLSCINRRLRGLVQQGSRMLRTADMSQVPPEKLAAALAWLQRHPAACSIRAAVLPVNHPLTPSLLATLAGLQRLQLYELGKVEGAEPPLASLPLRGLTQLRELKLRLARGALPKGMHLALPPQLVWLSLSASSFGTAVGALDLEGGGLAQLGSLELAALDTSNTKALGALVALPALRSLRLGRLWCVPPELHHLAQLDRLQLAVYGGAMKATVGSLEAPLSAKCIGLSSGSVPYRPTLQLCAAVSVLSSCDGLLSDWGAVVNLRSLSVENIYAASSGRFDVSALAALPRLQSLHLGFEDGVDQVAGIARPLYIAGLRLLPGLLEFSLQSTSPCFDPVLEAPPHLRTLLAVSAGRLVLHLEAAPVVEYDGASLEDMVAGAAPVTGAFSRGSLVGAPGRLGSIGESELADEGISDADLLRRMPLLGLLAAGGVQVDEAGVVAPAATKRRGAPAPAVKGALSVEAWAAAKQLDLKVDMQLEHLQVEVGGRRQDLLVRAAISDYVLHAMRQRGLL